MFRVRLLTYILFVVMTGLLGVATVLARSNETRARYELVELLEQERQLNEELIKARAKLAALTNPLNLERLNGELSLRMIPLRRLITAEAGGNSHGVRP